LGIFDVSSYSEQSKAFSALNNNLYILCDLQMFMLYIFSIFIPYNFKAIIIGILCYLGSISSPRLLGVTGGYYIFGRPLVAGLVIGITLGDVTTGVILGVAVQAVFIATISTGGTQHQEITYAAYGGIALARLANASSGVAVSLAVGIGVLGFFLQFNDDNQFRLEPKGGTSSKEWQC